MYWNSMNIFQEIFEQHDVTEDAKAIVRCVMKLVDKKKRKNYTLTYFVDIYKGKMNLSVVFNKNFFQLSSDFIGRLS